MRAEYLAYWNIPPEEADEAWEAKLRLMRGEFRAPMGFVQGDVCYDSPIDGRPITTKHARIEDMKRHGCIEYDPGMKQDAERRRIEGEAKLDKSVDEHVERAIATMPSQKKERLAKELSSGAEINIERK